MEIKLKDKFKVCLPDLTIVEVIYVRPLSDGDMLGCVEVDNTSNFHSVNPSQIIRTSMLSEDYLLEEEPEEYTFEVDRSYFEQVDPESQSGEDGEDSDESQEGEGDEESDEDSEGDKDGGEDGDKDAEGDAEPGDGEDGQPSDQDGEAGEGDGQDGGPSDQEGQSGDGNGEGGEPGEDNGERGEMTEGDPDQHGDRAEIIKTEKHPDEIGEETIRVRKKNRF